MGDYNRHRFKQEREVVGIVRVRKIGLIGLLLAMLAGVLGAILYSKTMPLLGAKAMAPYTVVALPPRPVDYQTYRVEQSLVHTLRIPTDAYRVIPAIASTTRTVEDFAQATGAIAVLNGGFFDPVNQQTTSYVLINGEIVADPSHNQRLTGNPRLTPYLDQILNRSEFRRYQCDQSDQTIRYVIVPHSEAAASDCQLLDSLAAGPRLLPDLTLESEAFVERVDGTVIRDAIGSSNANARTAIGIAENGDIVWVMAAQLPEAPENSGLSLEAIANFMTSLGVTQALNLDGGSSASLYYNGETFYGKLDDAGNPVQRPVKSVLILQPRSQA